MEVCEPISHEVGNLDTSVVDVVVSGENTVTDCRTTSEGVSNDTVTSFESNLGLEGVLTNGTDHLERNVGAVE